MGGETVVAEEQDAEVGAAAVVLDGEGRVLAVRENYGRRRWSLPGGALEPGETPEQAAVRETLEETGATIAVRHLIGRYELDGGFTVLAFRCDIVSGIPAVPASREIAEVAWLAADALPLPRSNVLHYALPDALAGRRDLVRNSLPRVG